MAALRGRGFRVYATLPGAPHTIEDVDVTQPIAVAFGNEHDGLSAAAVAACDGALGVQMFGFTESFNLSVTVALAMSRIAARRRSAIGAAGDLPDERRRELRARWFALKIRARPASSSGCSVAASVSASTRSVCQVVANQTQPGRIRPSQAVPDLQHEATCPGAR